MASTNITYFRSLLGRNYASGHLIEDSTSTPHPNGKGFDKRAQNPYYFWKSECRNAVATLNGPEIVLTPMWKNVTLEDLGSQYMRALASANNEAHAKFYGRLRHGGASLGVTLTQWKQTSEMITHRSRKLATSLDSSYELLRMNRNALKRLRNEREPLANQVLEGFFGWAPLMSDIKASVYTAVQNAIPDEWVKSTARRYLNGRYVLQDDHNGQSWCDIEGVLSVKYAANVRISNPNLWLANRLGLINLPSVAWDLVPWSFVVNWFVNSAQLIGSLTNNVGLTITNESVMTKDASFLKGHQYDTYFRTRTESEYFVRRKRRVINARPPLSLEFRLPKFNWSLAAIASSLVVQKISRINRLIRVI